MKRKAKTLIILSAITTLCIGSTLNVLATTTIPATVTGGSDNTASGTNASVSGGEKNTASGNYSSVSGGYNNTAEKIILQ